MSNNHNIKHPVILFDGVCNLCNGFVNLLIRLDKKALFRFLPLQSPTAKNYTTIISGQNDLSSVILVEANRTTTKSDAVLRISTYLPWPWRALKFFRFLPRKFRDTIYDFIARNRYNWFGKKDSCMIPAPEVMKRFL